MKIIRWLLSHTFLILLIVVIIYGYMFWGNLLGKETPAGKAVAYLSGEFVGVKDFVDAVKAKQARLSPGNDDEQKILAASDATTSDAAVSNTAASDTAAITAIIEDNTDHNDGAAVESDDGLNEVTQRKDVIVIESAPDEIIVTEKITTHIDRKQSEQMQSDRMQREQMQRDHMQLDRHLAESSQSNNSLQTEQASAVEAVAPGDVPDHEVTTGLSDGQINRYNQEELKPADGSSAVEHVAVQPVDEKMASIETSTPATLAPANRQNLSTADQVNTANKPKDAFISPEIEKQLDNVDPQGRVIDQAKANDAVRADWITARKSFYQRNYKLSEQSYKKVIDQTEDNFDAYGELGNVYFNQGKNKQAASAYYEAAAILVRKGEVARAKSLMGLLRHLDRSKATGLQALIDSEKS